MACRGCAGESTNTCHVMRMNSLRIRQGHMGDFDAVRNLRVTVLPPEHPYAYEKNLCHPNASLCLIAHDAQNLTVGFISVLTDALNPEGDLLWKRLRPYIGFVGVLPEYQRKGICRTLVDEVCSILVRAYPTDSAVFLECEADLQVLYEKLGFVIIDHKEIESRYGLKPHPRSLLMQKVL
jgi:ribosomal protein S18 acetylase RimI-like enzyme